MGGHLPRGSAPSSRHAARDFTALPLNEAGIRKAMAWDENARSMRERQCVPHVVTCAMRGPASIRLSKTRDPDSGRLIAYNLQGTDGRSRTIWMDGGPGVSLQRAPPRTGALKVVTTNLRAGYLRRNGVPYSENAVMTEYFDRLAADGTEWMTVLTVVEDPQSLDQPFITSTHVKREADASKWAPAPCEPGARASR